MTSSDFAKKFKLPSDLNPIEWAGNDIGFNILKKKKHGCASLYKIGLVHTDLDTPRRKLWLTAACGKESEGGIVLREKSRLNDPLDLDSLKDFLQTNL